MGYHTDFEGHLTIDPPLNGTEIRLFRDTYLDHDKSPSRNPDRRPDSYCQWEVSPDWSKLQWDGGEKFYRYDEWLRFLAEKFFARRNHKLNGTIHWNGEQRGDVGRLVVKDNAVDVQCGRIAYD